MIRQSQNRNLGTRNRSLEYKAGENCLPKILESLQPIMRLKKNSKLQNKSLGFHNLKLIYFRKL